MVNYIPCVLFVHPTCYLSCVFALLKEHASALRLEAKGEEHKIWFGSQGMDMDDYFPTKGNQLMVNRWFGLVVWGSRGPSK